MKYDGDRRSVNCSKVINVSDDLSNLSVEEQKELLIGLLHPKARRVFPLSLAQQRLWFLDQLHPGNPVYNITFGLRLQGNLFQEALESSIRQLIQRHEILRTHFEVESGHPVQVVAPDLALEIPYFDLTDVPGSDRSREANRLAMEDARLPFDLATGPLLRFKLIRVATEEHYLLCVIHHITCDGWSLGIFVRELAALYDRNSEGPSTASLIDLSIQYGDYAEWQRQSIVAGFLNRQVEYWKQKLAGAPPLLQLPADHTRPPEQTHDGANQVTPIPSEIIHDLAVLGRAHKATLFMVLLAVFKTLVHYYAESDDILVGVPVTSRPRVELEDLVGFFVNTLVLRTDLSGDPSFCELLHREREVVLDAFAHADCPFEKVVEELNPVRTLSYTPVIQVMFSAVKATKFPKFADVSASLHMLSAPTSLFDLSMEFIEDLEDRYWLRVQYATQLFDYARIARMLDHYVTLLLAVADDPESRISELISQLEVKKGLAVPNEHVLEDRKKDYITASQPASEPHLDQKIEPHDALERILLRIWERVLSVSGIGIRDNFFDLGGHSLLAAHLVTEVEKVVECKVPVSSLFRASTVESFAEAIRGGVAWSPDPVLMEITHGLRGTPLFAIVQSGVDALGYSLLSRHLGNERPFYKLQAHASACAIVPFSIEELETIAREYIAAMRTIQHDGPYFLIGMCNGALIAEQMVLQLEAMGHDVGTLCIIDTFVMENSYIRWLVRLESFRAGRRCVAQLPFLAQVSHYKDVVKRRLKEFFSHDTEPVNPWTKAIWPGKEFQIRHFHAPVLLFRRPKQPYFNVKDRGMGWNLRSLSGVTARMVNATHWEMLREPAVGVIGAELKKALQRIDTAGTFDTELDRTETVITSH